MNFKKGDKVKFLYQDDHGTVTRVMGNGIVMVLNSDDFEVPAQVSELILDASATEQEQKAPKPTYVDELQARVQVKVEAKKSAPLAAQKNSTADDVSLWAGFVPADGKAIDKCDLDFYLINDSGYRICYNLFVPVEGSTLMSSVSGILEPDTKELVDTIKRADLSNLSVYRFQLIFAKDRQSSIIKPAEAELKMHAPKFYQRNYYKVNDFFDEDAVVLPVYQSGAMASAIKDLADMSAQAKDQPCNQADKAKKLKRQEKEVVDLHMTEIIEDERGMSPKEMLDYQMKVFREKLDEFIKDPNVRKAIFIHGKGNGTLKLEIRKCLDRNYKRYEYQDASFEEYGGGATLVYVK